MNQKNYDEIANIINKCKDRFGARPRADKGEKQDRFISYLELTKKLADYFEKEETKLEKYEDKLRFWTMELDDDNYRNLQEWVGEKCMEGLVDEESGGIIGYVNRNCIKDIIPFLNTIGFDRKQFLKDCEVKK